MIFSEAKESMTSEDGPTIFPNAETIEGEDTRLVCPPENGRRIDVDDNQIRADHVEGVQPLFRKRPNTITRN